MAMFNNVQAGEDLTFYGLIESLQKRFTPNKSSYYGATLSDGMTSVDARIWDCNLIESINAKAGEVYFFNAHVNEYAGKLQYVIKSIRVVDEGEVDLNRFFKSAPMTKEDLVKGIADYTQKITNKTLYDIVVKLIRQYKVDYFEYPAAVTMHHNFIGGLAYHTYSMLKLADTLIELYPGLNKNLLYAGTILHDLGKIKELSGTKGTTYTEDGNLLGHIVIGLQMIAVAAAELGVADSEEIKALEHLIASHHGELEFGSPKEPGMMEAWALHLIDLTDSKMASISPEIVKTKKGTSTAPIGSLNRKTLYVPDID